MATYSTNEFRAGLRLMVDEAPCAILDNEFVKPGQGSGVQPVRLRNLLTGRVVDKTYKSGEDAPRPRTSSRPSSSTCTAMTSTGTSCTRKRMSSSRWPRRCWATPRSGSRSRTSAGCCSGTARRSGSLRPTSWCSGSPTPSPGVRGDTASGANKPAVVETGATVRVPLFVDNGELLRIDTRTGEYVSRVKE